MVIDFEEFRRITETLGGVEMTVYKEFSFRQWTFPEGLNYLDGDLALASIRARYDFADGDRHRMRNQQILVKAVISKLLTAGTLTSPVTLARVVRDQSPYVTVDDELDARGWSRC